jgi:hypothetical protein
MLIRSEHDVMVDQAFEYCKLHFGNEDRISYSFDLIGTGEQQRPPKFGVSRRGSRPDLYGIRLSDGFKIIGEAKTKGDIENAHTAKQLIDYLDFIKYENAKLVFIVPIHMQKISKNFIKSVRPDYSELEEKIIVLPGGVI